MEYGCIGEILRHSFSKEIHSALADYDYILKELAKDEVDAFMKEADFRAINVTIPYKERVIPYLYEIDEGARLIGAVNTIVNKEGRLYGYNTDFYGMSELISHLGIDIKGKKVLILGTGGTSKTACAVARNLGAGDVIRVSRDGKEGAILYADAYKYHSDAELIINTTPLGMYPRPYNAPIDIARFPGLIGVIDAIYNPLRTRLVSDALERGIPAEGGLYMLVAQAVRASEIFLDTEYPSGTLESVYERMLKSKETIVLTGMPASGKSTVGEILAKRLGRIFVDTDEKITKKAQMPIPEIFKERGEAGFRDLESEVISEEAVESARIIATGGGAVLRPENIKALKQNGRIYFIDRPIDALIPTADRPLSSTKEDIVKRYNERYSLYLSSADVKINADASPEEVADKIIKEFQSH